jgi:soluble lytic murein transglycosylase-like protein
MTTKVGLTAALTGLLLLRYYRFAEAPPFPGSLPPAETVPPIEAANQADPSSSLVEPLDHYVLEASRAHLVPVSLLRSVIYVESSGDAGALSPKGAQGLMQLMPETARRLGVTDPFDPRQNVLGGARYLRFLLDVFEGDAALALAAYNAGENAVVRYRGIPPYAETRQYLSRVASRYQLELEARHGAP